MRKRDVPIGCHIVELEIIRELLGRQGLVCVGAECRKDRVSPKSVESGKRRAEIDGERFKRKPTYGKARLGGVGRIRIALMQLNVINISGVVAAIEDEPRSELTID